LVGYAATNIRFTSVPTLGTPRSQSASCDRSVTADLTKSIALVAERQCSPETDRQPLLKTRRHPNQYGSLGIAWNHRTDHLQLWQTNLLQF
jgi:hypothetical protein